MLKGRACTIIERSVPTIKEKTRKICNSLTYNKMPRIMIQYLMEQIELWLNSFPATDDLDSPSPATLVRGDDKPDNRTPRIAFGTHVMAYVGSDNSMNSRVV